MRKWEWIERRARQIMGYFGVPPEEAMIAAIEDWEWMRVAR
jgi:hypothetical protein